MIYIKYLKDKYLKRNKRNYSYYILLLFSFLCSYSVLTIYNYIDYYYTDVINENVENRTIKVKTNESNIYKLDFLYDNPYVEEIIENHLSNNEFEYKIIINKFNNMESILNILEDLNLNITLKSDINYNRNFTNLIPIFKLFIIIIYMLFILYSIIIVKNAINKEKNKIFILKTIGYSNRNINKIINSILFFIINRSFIINIIIVLLSMIFLHDIIPFVTWNLSRKAIILFTNYIIFIVSLILVKKIYIKKI